MGSLTQTFGRRSLPCEDCWDGYCTMNCGPKVSKDMSLSDLPFYQKPQTDDLMPQILREARADREEIKRLVRVAKAAEAMMAKAYGVAGGILCIPPCYEQSEFADAMADLRISNEKT